MDFLEIKNHYGNYSKKELFKLIMELYNDNVQMNGQLQNSVKQLDLAVAKNIEINITMDHIIEENETILKQIKGLKDLVIQHTQDK